MDKKLSSKRYESLPIDLNNKNSSQTLAINLIGNNKKVLEIGTSTGYVTKILKDFKNVVTGIEIDQEAAQIAKPYCKLMIVGNVEELDLDKYLDPASFDVILCGDILEHLKNPAVLLKRLKDYLVPDGYLVVSIPNFCHGDVLLNIINGDFHYTSQGLLDETHLHFFGLKNIYSVFVEQGYEIRDIQTTNISIGDTELKCNLEKIPHELLKFIRSLPNTDVYQFIFSAYPSINAKIPLITEPDINRLVLDSFVESFQDKRSALSQIVEKNQSLEDELSGVHKELALKENHVKNLDAIIRAKEIQIQSIETELTKIHEGLILKENHIKNLGVIVQEKDSQIQMMKDYTHLLSNNYARCLKDLDHLNKEIENKQRHIVNIEEELRICKMSIFKKIFNKSILTLQKHSPNGTKRQKLLELIVGSEKVFFTEGFRCLAYRMKYLVQQTLSKKNQCNFPAISTNINNLPGNIPFSLDKELSGNFTCPVDDLNEIWFFTATYSRKNTDMIFQIKENNTGKILRIVTIKGYKIFNNNWTHFRFDPIQNSKNQTFQFSLKSAGNPAAAVWFNPKQTIGQLQLYDANRTIQGSIGFQCFSAKKIKDLYSLWVINHEPNEKQLETLISDEGSFSYHPKISIITPVWNTDEKWLRLAIESVINQIYNNWELCIADGGSSKPYIKRVLNEYTRKDPRIKVKFLPENKGIASNSNEALSLATGDFIGFLDHDDEILPFTLYEVVKKINQYPDIQFVYSDEDKIDERGKRENPFFKPDWSPDLFLSQNYLCHFSVIRKTLIDSVGGFREGYDGSQDYDLFLRVTEKIPASAIIHIPKILYHWRSIQGSAANLSNAKPYAFVSAKNALQDALIRRKINGEAAEGLFPSSYRIRYSLINNPRISIIIPTKDKVDVLQRCIGSILERTSYKEYEIVIVDNQSVHQDTFDYYEKIKDNEKIRFLSYNHPFNFSAINNYAVSQVTSPYILFLNNDTEVISEEWLSAMLEHAQRENIGAVGAKLLYPGYTIQHAGIILGLTGTPTQKGVAGHLQKLCPDNNPGYFLRPHIIGNTSGVTAACMLMKKEVFEKNGGFDEDLAVAFNDVDLCLKLRQNGYLIVYTPYAKLFHYESLSRGYEDTPEKQKRFTQEVRIIRERWSEVIDKGDPYYNENLTIGSEDFSIQK